MIFNKIGSHVSKSVACDPLNVTFEFFLYVTQLWVFLEFFAILKPFQDVRFIVCYQNCSSSHKI
jgi:hypothetical protein